MSGKKLAKWQGIVWHYPSGAAIKFEPQKALSLYVIEGVADLEMKMLWAEVKEGVWVAERFDDQ